MKMGRATQHFVDINLERCNGCVLCMKACPMKAIRIMKDEKAHILGTCIDCGSCISICPKNAIEPKTSLPVEGDKGKYTIVTVSPVMYTQFGDEVMPNEIITALKGFYNEVYDQAYMHELFNLATEIHIRERRKDPNAKWPLISPICPVVNRLIYHRFPTLLPQFLPFLTPREIAARELRKKALERSSLKPEEISVYHITPCSAKMISVKQPLLSDRSFLDGVIGINQIYPKLKRPLGHITGDEIYHYSGGIGIGWARSGGEIEGLEGIRSLAVSGIKETIAYLERLELGLLEGVEYVEFRACHEGCIGGPLAALDRYEAKRITERLVRMFGINKRVKFGYVKKLYDSGFFNAAKDPTTLAKANGIDMKSSLERAKEVYHLWELLPQKDCGACGSPDCMSFAEDIIDGLQTPDRCVFFNTRR